MSSWERARYIPWSRIPEDPTNLTDQKERIFRDLQREADRQEKEQEERRLKQSNATSIQTNNVVVGQDRNGEKEKETTSLIQTQIPFKWGDLFKSAAFGGCIGAITGSVFGFMDSMRLASSSDVLKNASNVAKGKYMMEGTTRSATIFGVFFSGFHCVKYCTRVAIDPGEYTEIGIAGAISLGALMSKPQFRPAMPYASMLIIMDSVHLIMRQFNDD